MASRWLLKNARRITLEMIQKASRRTWMALTPAIPFTDPMPNTFDAVDLDPATSAAQRPQFYRRIRSLMISKRIEGSLDKASLASLMLEKSKFEWTQTDGTVLHDGPTILYLILSKINPSVKVGVSSLKHNLSHATMDKFKHNVDDLLDYMHENYTDIYGNQGTHDDYTLNLFDSLATSNNAEFLNYVQGLRDEWELDDSAVSDEIHADNLREKVKVKYLNMSKAKRWKKTEDKSSKVISALATKVTQLEKQLSTDKSAHATSGGSNAKLMIPEWRTKKKGNSIEKDGKTWHWCPHHVKKGLFDGL